MIGNQNFQKVSLQFYRQYTEGSEVMTTETAFLAQGTSSDDLKPKGEHSGLL